MLRVTHRCGHCGWFIGAVLAAGFLLFAGVCAVGAPSALAKGTAYVADYTNGALTPIATVTGVAGRPFPAGVGPRAMALSSNGRTAYVADAPVNQVSVIDLRPRPSSAGFRRRRPRRDRARPERQGCVRRRSR